MAWIWLLIAAVFEIIWPVAMKYSNGFTQLWPSVITVVAGILSMAFLAFAMKDLNLGTAYACWTGLGIIGATVLGVLLFQERLSVLQVVFVLMIVVGIIGLRVLSPDTN